VRVIELRTSRAAFADTLGQMRDWLDRNGRPLVRFERRCSSRTTRLPSVSHKSFPSSCRRRRIATCATIWTEMTKRRDLWKHAVPS
jgi:hypothetical protein